MGKNHTNTSVGQGSPEADPREIQIIGFAKDSKAIQWVKESYINKACCNNKLLIQEKVNLDPYLLPYSKVRSKCITNPNIRAQTLKLREEDIGDHLHKLGGGKLFFRWGTESNNPERKKN